MLRNVARCDAHVARSIAHSVECHVPHNHAHNVPCCDAHNISSNIEDKMTRDVARYAAHNVARSTGWNGNLKMPQVW